MSLCTFFRLTRLHKVLSLAVSTRNKNTCCVLGAGLPEAGLPTQRRQAKEKALSVCSATRGWRMQAKKGKRCQKPQQRSAHASQRKAVLPEVGTRDALELNLAVAH